MRGAPVSRRVARAATLLRQLFARLETPLVFRLWDGTTLSVGRECESACAVVFRSRSTFRRLLLRPTPLRFGEAYIAGDLDIDGDIFAAMQAANEIEHLRVPFTTRLAVLAGLLRI